jgi:hypothetical protein
MKPIRDTLPAALLLISLSGGFAMADMDLYPAGSEGVDRAGSSRWRLFSDRVMGGVSSGTLDADTIDGRPCLRMRGEVSLENNGGFVQMATDLDEPLQRRLPDFAGLLLEVYGNGERYNVHLRTRDMNRPWQSYRSSFIAGPGWQTVRLPFSRFEPYRIGEPLDVARIRRLGLVAIGRSFTADLCVARAAFYEQ